MKTFIILVILAVTPFLLADSTDWQRLYTPPDEPQVFEPGSRYKGETWPKRPFFIGTVETTTSEPPSGYPLARRAQIGVSDTVEVFVRLRNQTGSSYVLGTGDNPEDWMVPVLFDPRAEVKTETALLDTSGFDYEFVSWWSDLLTKLPSKPTSIDTLGGMGNYSPNSDLTLQYYLWNVPPQTYRVIMEVTDEAPTGFKMMNGWGLEVITVDYAKSAMDTINAWAGCYWRATLSGDSLGAKACVDTILTLYPKSIVGWALKAELARFRRMGWDFGLITGDTLLAMQALDSVKKFINYYEDPALPDSANLNSMQQRWMQFMKGSAEDFQDKARNPKPYIEFY